MQSNELIVCKVVVVGAGLSGLQTARLLHKQGIDVHVLEANETIGGRAKAHSFGEDGAIDLGGQWVGKNQTHIIKLLEEFGISIYQQYSKGKAVQAYPKYGNKTFTGTIPPLSVKGLLDLQFNGINQVERLMAGVNVDEPSLSDSAIEFDNRTVESFVETHCSTEDAKQTIALATRAIFGAEMGEISFLFFLYALKTAGGIMAASSFEGGSQEFKISGTAAAVAHRVAADLPSDCIHFNAPVTRLVQTDEGVTVYTGHPDTGGPVVRAAYAVLAIPPSQAGHVRFEPEMPFERVKLCEKSFMGACVKLFVRYEIAFWREDGFSGEVLFYDGENDLSPITSIVDGCSEDGKIKGLVVFLCGRHAQEYTRVAQIDPEVPKSRILAKLVECFGDKAGLPMAWVIQNWNTEPYIYGAYNNLFPTACLSLFGDAIRMPVGRVHFAGTETATEHAGYLSGAIQAGERAAAEVSECIKEGVPWSQIEANRKVIEERRARKPVVYKDRAKAWGWCMVL